MLSRKRRRGEPPRTHPRNKYAEKPPDFRLLASLYPSFHPFVFSSSSGRPTIDWTDFSATRELTRVLLHHDHGVEWWIPDGQLCPTVPNRSNYIHWIEDLLSSGVVARNLKRKVRGFDIGTGANCIYPLLGASLLGWSFVGSDVTGVALEWASKNVENNPHLSQLIEIRNSDESNKCGEVGVAIQGEIVEGVVEEKEKRGSCFEGDEYHGSNVLVGVIKDGEEFDFCMCNPPFFKNMEEAGLNPKTACGGTPEEMVCPGGERAFISRIIEDSVTLKQSFCWFTTMVGRKANLKSLISKLHDVGTSVVKTTEFAQGQTARWGLAWSFISPNKKSILSHAPAKSHYSFMIEGLPRKFGAMHILKATESFLHAYGAVSDTDLSSFLINVTIPTEQVGLINEGNCTNHIDIGPNGLQSPSNVLRFRISVFEQIPGTVLVKGSLLLKESSVSGFFSLLLQNLEESLRKNFTKKSNEVQ